jgi:hypothetical protein
MFCAYEGAYAQTIDVKSRRSARIQVFYVDFHSEPYAPVTPENIVARSKLGKDLEYGQFVSLAKVVNHRQGSGKFKWFKTRLSLRSDGRTLLVVDDDGGFLDTHSGDSGRLTSEAFQKLQEFMVKFSSVRGSHVIRPQKVRISQSPLSNQTSKSALY